MPLCAYRLDVRKFAFSNRIIEKWNSLTDTVVNCITVNNFKDHVLKELEPETCTCIWRKPVLTNSDDGSKLGLVWRTFPPLFPSHPFPSPPIPFPPLLPLPLEVGPHIAARWSGERLSSPSGSGRSPATRWFLVNFRLKITLLVKRNVISATQSQGTEVSVLRVTDV